MNMGINLSYSRNKNVEGHMAFTVQYYYYRREQRHWLVIRSRMHPFTYTEIRKYLTYVLYSIQCKYSTVLHTYVILLHRSMPLGLINPCSFVTVPQFIFLCSLVRGTFKYSHPCKVYLPMLQNNNNNNNNNNLY